MHRCGFVVDSKWWHIILILPWGVYEAKKKEVDHEAAEEQVIEAPKVYLGMLDNLACNTRKLEEYQFVDSRKYQIFCFASATPPNFSTFMLSSKTGAK
jgi:hypothetical protein